MIVRRRTMGGPSGDGAVSAGSVVWCYVVLCLALLIHLVNSQQLCDLAQGNSTIVMDLMESQGNQVDQVISPMILPIEGAGSEAVSLELSQGGSEYFTLQPDGRLTLNQPLDRDQDDLSAINFQVSCGVPGVDGAVRSHPVIVRVGDLNDNPPVFSGTPYSFQVPESTSVGATVFSKVDADDADAGVNGQVHYSIIPSQDTSLSDGFEFFSIMLPHQGLITLKRSLDYESAQKYQLTILAVDRSSSVEMRLSSSTTITVEVLDEDDQHPIFIYDNCDMDGKTCKQIPYNAKVTTSKISGVLDVFPDQIRAIDQDSLDAPVRYSFTSGTPSNFENYFKIDSQTGSITQTTAVQQSSIKQFKITIKAEEQSDALRFSSTELMIDVLSVDNSPPIISANSYSGAVEENAVLDTPVQDDTYPELRPLILTVIDPDLGPLDDVPEYSWELTTTAFKINAEGVLIVAEQGLDRDNPNLGIYTFQVVAREEGGLSKAASSPITLTVELTDINDNAPWLPVYPPVSIQAPGTVGQTLTKITAKDLDVGVNAEITYGFFNPSREIEEKFLIDSASGEIFLKQEVSKGDYYVLNIRATDTGGLNGSTSVDVSVGRGVNTGGPVFTKKSYSTRVVETVKPKTPILTLETVDPEGDSSIFTLVSGNELQLFEVGSSSGVVRILQPLDREILDEYILTIMAQDPYGLASNTTVVITVTDVNDNIPQFKGLPYSFRVDEGKKNIHVGSVMADDLDSGVRGEVSYTIKDDSYFVVENTTGLITTNQELDYEKQQVHYLVVVAGDGAEEPELTTATVTVLVSDLQDEYPHFTNTSYQAQVEENVEKILLTTVEAVDPDTQPEISYVLVSGDGKLFHVDPESGDVSTKFPLDYEAQPVHKIIIGTLQNPTKEPNATCTVTVSVMDVNDNPPIFSTMIPSSYISETTPPGWIIGNVIAYDNDATEPNSLIKYTLAQNEQMNRFFSIDESSGVLTLKEMLKDIQESSIEVIIIASDLGVPPLSTNTSVTVRIEREFTEEIKNYTSFSSDEYFVSVAEDVGVGDVLTKLSLINAPSEQRFHCAITNGNGLGLFGISGTNENECNVAVARALDYEDTMQHRVTVEIYEPFAPPSILNRITKVNISITDVNDNIPQFEFDAEAIGAKSNIFHAVVSQDAPISTSVIKVLAQDGDAGPAGQIQYSLPPQNNRGSYFSIAPSTGIIRIDREISSVPVKLLPFNLTVVATDNNGNENSNRNTANVIINLIQPKDRLVLVIKSSVEEIETDKMKIVSVLEEYSDHIIEIEKVECHEMMKNGSRFDTSHVWFHMINPETGALLNYDHPHFNRLVSKNSERDMLLYQVEATLGKQALEIQHPHSIMKLDILEDERDVVQVKEANSIFVWNEIQVPLFVLAGVILVLGIIGIIFVCIQWQRYLRHRDEPSKAMVIVAPPYEPVTSVIESEGKEYEIQVLSMSVPMDDDSMDNVPISTRASHHFSMDNVSYITKQQQSEDESSTSEIDDDMTLSKSSRILDSRQHHSNWDHSPVPNHLPHSLSSSTPIGRNPAYERFPPGDEDVHDEDDGPLSVSSTNDNVMFARQSQPDHFSSQTTTEL